MQNRIYVCLMLLQLRTCYVTYNFFLCRSSKSLTMEYKTLGFIVIKKFSTANNRKTAAKIHFRNFLLKVGIP